MTFPTIRLPFMNLTKRALASPQTPHIDERPEDTSDVRREYLDQLIAADACVGEFGVQALMGLYPKDF